MKTYDRGTRVGVVFDTDDHGNVAFLGYGIYEGEEMPPAEFKQDIPTPKIKLDSGEILWGHEAAWYGVEDEVKKFLEGRNMIPVNVEAARKAREAMGAAKDEKTFTTNEMGHKIGTQFGQQMIDIWADLAKRTQKFEAADSVVWNALASQFAVVYTELTADSKLDDPAVYRQCFNDARERFMSFLAENVAQKLQAASGKVLDGSKKDDGESSKIHIETTWP